MGIGATNRIINPQKILMYSIKVKELEKKLKARPKRSFRFTGQALVICTQCKRAFSAHIGNQQIQNKRENAPICIPCIMGIPRRPKEQVIKTSFQSKYSKETQKKLEEYKKKYRRKV